MQIITRTSKVLTILGHGEDSSRTLFFGSNSKTYKTKSFANLKTIKNYICILNLYYVVHSSLNFIFYKIINLLHIKKKKNGDNKAVYSVPINSLAH